MRFLLARAGASLTPAAAASHEPPVAHMVADLDEIEAEERAIRARRAVRGVGPLLAALRGAAALSVLALAASCAGAGATFRSGVGDAYLEHPPYYAGARAAAAGEGVRIGHLPVAYQRGAAQPALFDPRDGSGTPVAALFEDMTSYLDSLGASVRLVEGRRVSAVAHRATTAPPDVHFGCAPPSLAPGEECAERGDSVLGRGGQTMRLAVGRPGAEWVAWIRDVTAASNVDRVLVITLEVGQYLPRQSGWRGDKSVELGTGHVATLPWLTSLETPVSVLQVTGALVDRDGRAVRIGAEGILARRTNIGASGFGFQRLITDEDVAAARVLRRDDLPGGPLAWQVALRHLVARLAGRTELAPR